MLPLWAAASHVSTGDLVFVRPPANASTPLAEAILETGEATLRWMQRQNLSIRSNWTADHVALAVRNSSGVFFVEAVWPAVQVTAASAFYGREPHGTTFFHGA